MGKSFSRLLGRRTHTSPRINTSTVPNGTEPVQTPPKLIVNYNSQHDRDRMENTHWMYKQLLNGNFQSPVHEVLEAGGAQVLHIGSGPGYWELEMAKDYPKSTMTGIDIDPKIFPTSHPYNCNFIVGDVTKGLPFPDNRFDFVFSRLMIMSLSQTQWSMLISELVRVTKPGGYIELVEPDMECMQMGPKQERLSREVLIFLREKRLNPTIGRHLGNLLDNIPSVTLLKFDSVIQSRITYKGAAQALFLTLKPQLMPRIKMTSEEYDRYVEVCADECDEYDTFLNIHYAYGRKDSEADNYSTVSSRGKN